MIKVFEKLFGKKKDDENLDSLIVQGVKRGGVYANFYFDAHGKDKDAVRDSLVDFVSRLTKEEGIVFGEGRIEEALEKEGGELYSAIAEVTLFAKSFRALVALALKYGPVAAEIMKPEKMTLENEDLQGLLVDASLASQQFSTHILEKTMKPEDLKKFKKKMEARAELGRKARERAAKKSE